MALVTHDESAAVFYWKGESIEEYWYCILNTLIYMEDYGKGHRPDLIVYCGGDMNILIHEVKKSRDLFLKGDTIPDPSFTDNAEFKIFQTVIKRQLESGETDNWKKMLICVWEFMMRSQREFNICREKNGH